MRNLNVFVMTSACGDLRRHEFRSSLAVPLGTARSGTHSFLASHPHANVIVALATVVAVLLIGAGRVDAAGPVVINEVAWMGSPVSSADEWVELKNVGAEVVDLSGWVLEGAAASGGSLTLPAGSVIAPGGYYLIANYGSASDRSVLAVEPNWVTASVSLSNSAFRLTLKNTAGETTDVAGDGGAPVGGEYEPGTTWKAMERNFLVGDGSLPSNWHESRTQTNLDVGTVMLATPAAPNSRALPVPVLAAIADEHTVGETIYFDAAETVTGDAETLTFNWDFGDGALGTGSTPTHHYAAAGSYTVTLTVSGGEAPVTVETVVEVAAGPVTPASTAPANSTNPTAPPRATIPAPSTTDVPDATIAPVTGADLVLSEVLPNPVGPDQTEEFIEIENRSGVTVPLAGWQLTDTKIFYRFSADATIEPHGFFAVLRLDSKITLNNSADTLYLIAPDRRIVSGVRYERSAEGESFSRVGGNHWEWTTIMTAGEANVFDEDDEENTIVDASPSSNELARVSTIVETKQLSKGERITISGTVTVVPGVLGSQYFYVADGSAGIQIFSAKKLFPALAIGDAVRVAGTVSVARGEVRVNTGSAADIVVRSSAESVVPTPIESPADELVGSLVAIEGELIDSRADELTVGLGDDTIAVPFKDGAAIEAPIVEPGAAIEVAGILKQTETGDWQIWPRGSEDIALVSTNEGIVAGAATGAQTNDDALAAEQTIVLPDTSNTSPTLLVGSIALVSGFAAGYVVRKKREEHTKEMMSS